MIKLIRKIWDLCNEDKLSRIKYLESVNAELTMMVTVQNSAMHGYQIQIANLRIEIANLHAAMFMPPRDNVVKLELVKK